MHKILRDRLKSLAVAAALAITGVAATPAAEQTLMLYGDSLMAGLGLSEREAFAGRLQQALGDQVTIVNASVSGDTSADGLARLDWSLADRPDAVVLELGANDMLQGLGVEAMRGNLASMLERFSAEGIPVLLVGMRASPSLGSDYVQAYEAVFPELAAQVSSSGARTVRYGVLPVLSRGRGDGCRAEPGRWHASQCGRRGQDRRQHPALCQRPARHERPGQSSGLTTANPASAFQFLHKSSPPSRRGRPQFSRTRAVPA